jgi:hypothetical protein
MSGIIKPGKRKIGIALIHLGIVLLLAGQMLTDILSVESVQHLRSVKPKITPNPNVNRNSP